MRPDDSPDRDETPQVSSEVSGSAFDVVQARDVEGGIHFHGRREPGRPRPSQLPGGTSGFVNRLHELARLNEALERDGGESLTVGLFLITGTAGVGKTSLALHWAHSARHRFPDGQLYVNLRGYDPGAPVTAEQALHQFLRALGVPSGAIPVALEDRSTMFRSLLADRRMLVVLDNAANPAQVRPLLPGSPTCLVLVTSRNRFSGLVARDGARRLVLDMLTEDEAVRLLRTVTTGSRHNDDARDLVELARLCARLPLALRIAAERTSSRPLMMLNELIDDLRDESALWDALTADQDDESDAVRTVFAWSYRALPEAAARLFRLLGLHPGPEFCLTAAAAIAGTSLSLTKKLLERFGRCLEIARSLGDLRWQALATTNVGCAQYDLMDIPAAVETLNRSVLIYQEVGDRAYEGNALFHLAMAQREQGDLEAATESIERALRIAEADRHVAWEAFWLMELGRIQRARGDAAGSLLSYQRSAVVQRQLSDRNREALALDGAGEAYRELGRADEAEKFHRTAAVSFRETADRWSLGRALTNLALALKESERLEQAATVEQEAIDTLAVFDDPRARQLVTLLRSTNR